MKKKTKEPYPDIYKIVYRLKRWKTKSERYFTVFSAQEAFDVFYYAFMSGHVNSDRVTVYKIYKYDRYADRWYDQTSYINYVEPHIHVRTGNKCIITRPQV